MIRFPTSHNRYAKIPTYVPKVAGIAALLLILAVLSPSIPAPVTDVAHQAATPLWQTRDSMLSAVYGAVAILETKGDLIRANEELHDEISTLRREAFATEVLRDENARLRELLNRPDADESVAAAVLSRPSSSPYDTLIIDAGLSEGLRKGNIVSVSGGVAIGTVEAVFSDTATVMLFSAPGKETPVVVGTATPTPSVALGWGGGNFAVELPRDAEVAVDDPVILPTLSPHVFAKVASVEHDPTDPLITVRFQVPVNVATLRHVLVETDETFIVDEVAADEAIEEHADETAAEDQ